MIKRPYNPDSEQPLLTGVPEFYDDKSELKDEIVEQNKHWEEAGRKARMTQSEDKTASSDDTAKTLLDKLVTENRAMFQQFMAEAKKEIGEALQPTDQPPSAQKLESMLPPYDLLDRWFKRFAAYKYDIEHTADLREANRLRTALYNDTIATLFDVGLEMSKLIGALESR
jgi:hypothetical protein